MVDDSEVQPGRRRRLIWSFVWMLSPLVPAMFGLIICWITGPIPAGSNHTNLYGNDWASDLWEGGLNVSGLLSLRGMFVYGKNSPKSKAHRAGVILAALLFYFVCFAAGLIGIGIAYD